MQYRTMPGIDRTLSLVSLGTWAFGGDHWWGKQDDKDSIETMEQAIKNGINAIDTAPVYGIKNHS